MRSPDPGALPASRLFVSVLVCLLLATRPGAAQPAAAQPAAAQPGTAETGSILGQLFTAEHPDSVAAGAELTLIFRAPDGEVQRVPGVAGPHGEYEFPGLSTDPSLQYVVRVSYFGRDFLGAPMQFDVGQTRLAYNFLVARDAAPIPTGGMEGHPPISSDDAPAQMGQNGVRQDPFSMTVIVLAILALFGLPIATAYRRDRQGPEGKREDPEAAALIRDIASLDLRYSRGELEASDYEAVRRSLIRRLHALTGVQERSA